MSAGNADDVWRRITARKECRRAAHRTHRATVYFTAWKGGFSYPGGRVLMKHGRLRAQNWTDRVDRQLTSRLPASY